MSLAALRPRTMTAPVRVGLVALVTALAVALHLWYGIRHNFFDLNIYRAAVRWWADGNPLYGYAQPDATQGELGFTYPPFAAVLLRPFAALPVGVWVAVYVAVFVAALALVTWWLVAPLAARRGVPRWFAVAIGFWLFTGLEPIRETFSFGQINMLLVLLVAVDLLVLLPRGSRFAGVGIGLATALKLIPGIFLIYLLVSRRWRTALVAAGTALGATLFAAAVAPGASRAFWTDVLFQGEGVGKLHYTFNQSLMGMLARLAEPAEPSRVTWALLAAAVAAFGLWRAPRAARAGDEVAGLALAGLVGSLISPVTWVHHIFWFAPALVVLVRTGRRLHLALAALVYATVTVSLVALWEFNWGRFGGPPGFVLSNWDVLLALLLLAVLPIRTGDAKYAIPDEQSGDSQKPLMPV